MKKTLCTLLSLWLCLSTCTLALGEATTVTLDYTIAEKLFKQLESGSGFAGTLTLSLTAREGREKEAITTKNPFLFECTYISVPADSLSGLPAERRYELTFMDGENPRALASLALRSGATYLKSNLLGADWYVLPEDFLGIPVTMSAPASNAISTAVGGAADATSTPESTDALFQNPVTSALQGLIDESAMPALFSFILPALLEAQNHDTSNLADALSTYTTRIDLWIEGYRKKAELGKLEDGTTTMEVQYTIPHAAIQEQLKDMVEDILGDAALLAKLQALLPEEQALLLLNPQLRSFYLYAIDELPLRGDLTISRAVNLEGETLALHLALPLYDQTAGEVTLSYDRKAGTGKDLSEEDIISLESQDANVQAEYKEYQSMSLESQNIDLRAEYKEYRSMSGVAFYQGTIRREPKNVDSNGVGEDSGAAAPKIFSAAFTLKHDEQLKGKDEENYETLTHDYNLTLEPRLVAMDANGQEAPLTEKAKNTYYQFPAFDLAMNLLFKSKPEKNASTSFDLTLRLSGEDIPQTLDLTFTGKSKARWTPTAIDDKSAQRLSEFSQDEFTTFLTEAGLKTGICFLPFMSLPKPAKALPPSDDAQASPSADQTAAP